MTVLIGICRAVLNLIYSVMKLRPVKKKVVFLSRQSDEPSLDILELEREMRNQHPDYETVLMCRKIGSGIAGKLSYCFHILGQMNSLSTAEIAVLDSYCIPASLLNHRKSLLIIQMWHSVGTMKKFAYSILDKPEGSSSKLARAMRMHKNYDWILCAGEGYRSHLAQGFGYPENKIVIYPLPRVEVLQNAEYAKNARERIFSEYPELKSGRNVLYVPTFRKGETEKAEFAKAAASLKAAFSEQDDLNLIVKPHPLSGASDTHPDFSSFDLLFAADFVISDYSCIMYEAAIVGKPLFFYTYDYDEYMRTRDIYMDYAAEIPNAMYSDPFELAEAVANEKYDMAKQEKFLKKYVDYDMPDIVKSTVKFIFDHRK